MATDAIKKAIEGNDVERVGAVIATGPNSTQTLRDNNSEYANVPHMSGILDTRFDDPTYYG